MSSLFLNVFLIRFVAQLIGFDCRPLLHRSIHLAHSAIILHKSCQDLALILHLPRRNTHLDHLLFNYLLFVFLPRSIVISTPQIFISFIFHQSMAPHLMSILYLMYLDSVAEYWAYFLLKLDPI